MGKLGSIVHRALFQKFVKREVEADHQVGAEGHGRVVGIHFRSIVEDIIHGYVEMDAAAYILRELYFPKGVGRIGDTARLERLVHIHRLIRHRGIDATRQHNVGGVIVGPVVSPAQAHVQRVGTRRAVLCHRCAFGFFPGVGIRQASRYAAVVSGLYGGLGSGHFQVLYIYIIDKRPRLAVKDSRGGNLVVDEIISAPEREIIVAPGVFGREVEIVRCLGFEVGIAVYVEDARHVEIHIFFFKRGGAEASGISGA